MGKNMAQPLLMSFSEKRKSLLASVRRSAKTFFLSYGALFLLLSSLALFFFGLHLYHVFIPEKSLRVTFFDVGQGDGILIESGAKTKVLIDGGASLLVIDKLSREISLFDRRIDLIAPSHADKDHIVGSIAALQSFPALYRTALHASSANPFDEEYVKMSPATKALAGKAFDTIDIGSGATLTFLHPRAGEVFSDKETNDSSAVLLLTYQQFSFLFTGDLPESHETELIESGLLPERLTVLKLGHHGSKTSSGKELLTRTKPQFVIVSAGKDNRYGHPSKETLERVEKVGSKMFSTIDGGDITFEMRNGKLKVVTEK